MKVTQAEGLIRRSASKCWMDWRRRRVRSCAARERLKAEKGEDATKAWNTAYALGELTQLIDPYYPFEKPRKSGDARSAR